MLQPARSRQFVGGDYAAARADYDSHGTGPGQREGHFAPSAPMSVRTPVMPEARLPSSTKLVTDVDGGDSGAARHKINALRTSR